MKMSGNNPLECIYILRRILLTVDGHHTNFRNLIVQIARSINVTVFVNLPILVAAEPQPLVKVTSHDLHFPGIKLS